MHKLKKILIMAGGTGGHVFPGLAVAKRLMEQGVEVHWLGTQTGLEAKLVPQANIPIHYIVIGGLRGKGIKNLLQAPFKIFRAVVQSIKIIRQIKPDVVLGMGGFASGPGGIASWLLRVPVVIHEQNAKVGMTNAWLSHAAKKVLEGFPDTFSEKKLGNRLQTVGNPVRAEIANLPAPEIRFTDRNSKLRLLVIGGSLGAQALNELLPQALALLPEENRPDVLHQTGEKFLEQAKAAYAKANVKNANVVPFIQEMDKAYAAADLVICRAGALTVAELCVAGIGAILVPFPHAADDHQTLNGNFMVKQGAAILIQQKNLSAEKLAELLKDFSLHREKCVAMSKAAYSLRRIDATEKVELACREASQQ